MVHGAWLNPFDVKVFHWINHFAGYHSWLNPIMVFFAKDALEVYAVLFVVAWFVLPKRDIQSRHALFIAGLSGILALILNVVISHVWFRPRPFVALHKGTFTELIHHSPDASFPSDHVSGSFGFAAASWGKNQRWVSYTFTILAVVVMVARVYVGVHYPTDVLAGTIVGIFASQIMWKFANKLFPITRFVAGLFKFGPMPNNEEHSTNHSESM